MPRAGAFPHGLRRFSRRPVKGINSSICLTIQSLNDRSTASSIPWPMSQTVPLQKFRRVAHEGLIV